MSNKTEPTQGPFKHVETKTIEIAGPIKIIVKREVDSTHVPPAPCGCGGGSAELLAKIMQAAGMAGAAGSASSDDETPQPH